MFDDYIRLNIDDQLKVPADISKQLPENLFIKKVAETIILQHGKITDIMKIRSV